MGLSMNSFHLLGGLALGLMVVLAGCTGFSPTGGTTTTPTTLPTPTFSASIEPSPTDVVPPTYLVEVSVDKNTIPNNPDITVSYRDGAGTNLVSQMDIIVVRSDGAVETRTVTKPDLSTVIVFPGTTGTDRVVVFVSYYNGSRYKIYDRIAPFQPLNPY